jgi:hypothetical protein
MRKNSKELPDIINHKQKQHESLFYEDEKGSLLSINQCKKDKNVINIAWESWNSNPKTFLDYNKSNVGVNSVYQMTRQYSVCAASTRWPVCVFYNIINLTIINSWILYKNMNNTQISRRTFILNLIEEIKTLKSQDDSSQNTENTPLGKRKEAASIDTPVNKRVRRSLVETPSKEFLIIIKNCFYTTMIKNLQN